MDYTPRQGLQKYMSDNYDTPDSRSDLITSSYMKKNTEPFTFNSENIDDLKAGTANILVAVRCRPLSQKESSISDIETIGVVEDRVVVLREPPNDLDPREVLHLKVFIAVRAQGDPKGKKILHSIISLIKRSLI
jgi:hypothetical protein